VQERESAAKRGYDHRWRKAREHFLRLHPLCVFCTAEKVVTLATVVDHIAPHRGDFKLFWNQGNWQPLCKVHHDRDKQRLEKSGTQAAKFDAEGRVIW
jgi:5-methylcytosine-specific restriction protein A